MKINRSVASWALIIFSLIIYSCKKDIIADGEIQKVWQCNATQRLDSFQLANNLVGSWQLTKSSNTKTSNKLDKTVVVTFTSLRKFIVVENSVKINQGIWFFKIVDGDILGLSLDVPDQYLNGRILICEPQILFNDSYRDGTDNFFKRIK